MALDFDSWLKQNHHRFLSLTDAVVLIMTRLLNEEKVSYLTISGRTKPIDDCLSKVKRKSYNHPIEQLTDISGVRIILYFDYDVEKVSEIIRQTFNVDEDKSLDKTELLSADQVGYRSVHFVCDLGKERTRLKEYAALRELKFEFQVRTVLQHAWAEISHDRNYKFNGSLPNHLERQLYLLAGLLETADNGFSALSTQIDQYMSEISKVTDEGNLEDVELNSLSLSEFVQSWAEERAIKLHDWPQKDGYLELLDELRALGITNLKQLNDIIPEKYAEVVTMNFKPPETIYGLVRDWMIISKTKDFIEKVEANWAISSADMPIFNYFLSGEEINELLLKFEYVENYDDEAYLAEE